MVADLLERGDGGEDLTLARLLALCLAPVTSVSSTAWYSPICSGVIAQWSSSSIWSGSSAAISGSDFVRRNTRMPLSARIASSASAACGPTLTRQPGMNCGRGADESGVGEVEDGPEVAEAVLDRRAGERHLQAGVGMRAQLLGGVVGGVLDGLGLVEHQAATSGWSASASMSRTAVP